MNDKLQDAEVLGKLPVLPLDALVRLAVEQSLLRNHGNRTQAARELGISVRTLQRKMNAWGISVASRKANKTLTKETD